ncbi:MAG: hydantoinase B/oxoprolinase family protein [Gammaproteobacteria bacterium]|jgi:N-methylhydantoinase B|nr:hydantoinase B/oxoprolinase family protein [Gammaproteobacteria bacterium]|tara:strand:+ start:16054 stop:17721 length:1668 start_codon:yes stop_codon:yes gene_type:complete
MILTPVEIELLRNAITSIADEMYIALMKSAYSTNIKERRDHSTAIFDANGRVVAQGESMPLHLASMLGLVEVVLEKYDPGSLQPGDMFLSNDPFVGRGSHLPDVSMAAPVFSDGKLVMFVANIAHHADIGGMVPGSMAGGMTEIYQEGLRIPPIRLIAGGQLQEDLMDLILLNVRVPEERRGDYNAQIAANKLGVKRCQSIVEKWSIGRLTAGMDAMIQAVAQRMRAAISDIPDNKYQFTDVIDDDGIDATQIKLVVEITVQGDEIIFDFEGTSPQVKGNINVTMAGLQAACLYSLKVLIDPECPQNHGMLDPISIKAPLGTIVNAEFPAASAARAQTGQRIVDLIFGALADALPERIIAAGNGANTSASFFGRLNDGRFYVYLETLGGGAGGRAYQDGTDGVQVHMTNTSNLPIESLETEYPLMIERYELVPDSGGAGKWRGGLGLRRIYRPVGHTVTFSGQGERFVNSPWGLFGGHSGATGSFDLVGDDGTRQHLSNKPSAVEVNPDTVIIVTTPGAGGYGLPVERNQEALHDDARSEKFSARFLEQKYNYLE